ncbi:MULTISPECIES: ABC transporter substrate-binding protein [unclassified Pseudofrankia]|uniref:ABC transporter substrate-binding protein n=1 Tax=unclassified Pseudofrankia TaxID=2994372 RepID=UPI0008DAF1A0|nr:MULTISPECIES: ABC transporter substrate-binding protein [unclassified Pseudofrankia]MDT3441864.1 ABC transporter substrate-binding protein [Pseudofrankia sp. BMG5.37]OHV45666.1 branched-chain amino acid ABC transporter substrate-binding protein [Pseudofrankia sp. BMG5.36]
MLRTEISPDRADRVWRWRRPAATRWGAAALAAGLVAVLAACGGGSGGNAGASSSGAPSAGGLLGPSNPAKGTPVRIGLISDDKGPVSDLSIETAVAKATVGYLNDHKGGIAGHPIELVTCKALADPANGTDCANRMVEDNVTAVLVGTSSVVESIWQPLQQAHMPTFLSYGAGDMLKNADTTFFLTDFSYPVKAVIQQAKDKGAKKVTAITIDVPAAMGVWNDVAPAMFKSAGLQLEVVPIPPGTADMTPQIQSLISRGDPGVVQVVGNDAFCISAFNGLRAVGFTGVVVPHPNCMSDKTRTAVPSSFLKGLVVPGVAPVGVDSPSTRLYKAVVAAYGGKGIDTGRVAGLSMFTQVAAFQLATAKISGDVTAESIVAAIRAMPEQDLPGAGGLRFRCNGKAIPSEPAVCVRGWLTTTLDDKGQPTDYLPVGVTPIEN